MGKKPGKISEPQIGISSTYDYFFEILKPNRDEFIQSPGIRTALNAALAMWHMHEWHYWKSNPPPAGNNSEYQKYRDQLITHKEFLWIRDIALTAKHLVLSRTQAEVTSMSKNIDQSSVFLGGALGVAGFVAHSIYQIEADGKKHDVNRLFAFAFDYWLNEIMPIQVPLTLSIEPERRSSLSEDMIAWCRETFGHESAPRRKWHYWGRRDPAGAVRFSFYQQHDADVFRAHWAPFV